MWYEKWRQDLAHRGWSEEQIDYEVFTSVAENMLTPDLRAAGFGWDEIS